MVWSVLSWTEALGSSIYVIQISQLCAVYRMELQFEFTDGFEIMHKAWYSIEEAPYYLGGGGSSIKFQVHTGWKIN